VGGTYALELAELTSNSKPIINSLTMIADDSLAFSATIAKVILDKIGSALGEKKLPVIYLLDSITKNVKGDYIDHFSAALPEAIGGAYAASSPKVRASLQRLLNTWPGVFPNDVLARVAERFSAAPPAGAGGAGPAPPRSGGGEATPPPSQQAAAVVGGGAPPPKRKRARPDGTAGGREALKLELSGLMGRINAHLASRMPPDTQFLQFIGQAISLNESLISEAPAGSAEARDIEQQLTSLRTRHTTVLAQLQAEGIPIPAAARAPPPPASRFSPPRKDSQTPAIEPPPLQPAHLPSQPPPPPPPDGPPGPPAPSPPSTLLEPPAPPPGEPPSVDVSKLLNDLAAAGVIASGAAGAPAATPPAPPQQAGSIAASLSGPGPHGASLTGPIGGSLSGSLGGSLSAPTGSCGGGGGCGGSCGGLSMPGGTLSQPGGTLGSRGGMAMGGPMGGGPMGGGPMGGPMGGGAMPMGDMCSMGGGGGGGGPEMIISNALHALYMAKRQQCQVRRKTATGSIHIHIHMDL